MKQPVGLLLLISLLGACGDSSSNSESGSGAETRGSTGPQRESVQVPSGPIEAPVTDYNVTEPAARRLEQDLGSLLLEPLSRGQLPAARRALTGNFRGGALRLTPAEEAGPVSIEWFEPVGTEASAMDADGFLRQLHGLAPLEGTPDRVECEVDRFELDAGESLATGHARLRWAGRHAENGSRVDLTLYGEFAAARSGERGDWSLGHFIPTGQSVRLTAPRATYLDRTADVGLTFGTSPENLGLLQKFIDRHETLTLGGISVVDWNGDDRPDLLATSAGEETVVFVNDGHSGFVPEPTPISDIHERPAFCLFFDLDGDGLEEIVAGQASLYEGDRAFAGLWTRTGAAAGTWRHVPRAFAMPNPVGLRRLAIQSVTPFDADGDGDTDLFFSVYGSGESRGDHYNVVEAYDGGDNHLFINGGELSFTEESEARGIHGTGYTFVALAFDVDHDGDPDVLEGNDFGPNVLWLNDGGNFTADETRGFGGVSANSMGAALADLEARGRWDLYVSNMSSEQGMRMIPLADGLSKSMRERVDTIARGNMLYREPQHRGPAAAPYRWPERAQALGVHEGEWAWACQFVEPHGDGHLGLFVTNGFTSHRDPVLGDWQSMYWDQVIDDARALEEGRLSRNVNADKPFRGSFNGYERDRFFVRADVGDPDRRWVDAGWILGMDDNHDGRAAAAMDADGDGDMDLCLLTLKGLVYRENRSGPGDWVRLRLRGKDGISVPLGARVSVVRGGSKRNRHVAVVEGFQSQISTDVHVGFGPEGRSDQPVERVVVTWPDGAEDSFENVPVNQLSILVRGQDTVESRALPRWDLFPGPAASPTWRARLAAVARTPAALGSGAAYAMIVRVHAGPPPGPQLLDPSDEKSAGIRIVDAYLRGTAQEGLRLDGRTSAMLDPELFADAIGNSHVSTIVYTRTGECLRVFRGEVQKEDVLRVAELARREPPYRHLLIEHGRLALAEFRYRDAAQLFEQATQDESTLRAQDALAFEGLGRAHIFLGRTDKAERAYRRAVELDPDYFIGHFNLAATFTQTGRFEEALAPLAEARRLEGDSRRVMGATAEAQAGAGDLAGALESLEAWLGKAPDDAGMLVLAGQLEAKIGNFPAAQDHLERALSIEPGNGQARAILKEIRTRLKATK